LSKSHPIKKAIGWLFLLILDNLIQNILPDMIKRFSILFSSIFVITLLLIDCKSDPPVVPPNNCDTTSHDFTWQIDTLGDASGILYDVAIINDTLVYAVGEIYLNDSSGILESTPYGLAIWNGKSWKLKRIFAKYPNSNTPLRPLGILSFSATDIWFAWGDIFQWNGKSDTVIIHRVTIESTNPNPVLDPGQTINRLCGSSNNNIYGVGGNGGIVHYNNTDWQKLDSKTNTDIQDIYGVINKSTGQYEAYCAVTDFFQPKERKVLKITNTTQVDSIPWTPNKNVNSVWTIDGSFLYAGGDGLYENSSGTWKQINYGANKYIQHIRGSSANNIVVVGDAGLVVHYNGSTWRTFPFDFNTAFNSVAVTDNMIVAVGTNGKAIIAIGKKK
jgi:hypothetical protein